MNSSISRGLSAAGLLLFSSSSLLAASTVASCADTDQAQDTPDTGGNSIPAIDAADVTTPDGGDACPPGDVSCRPYDAPCTETEWCPFETGADSRRALTSIWGSGKNDVWAVGAAGSILHWDGTRWSDASTGSTYTLFGVGGSGPSDVWTVSTPAILFHGGLGPDGGAAWQRQAHLAPQLSYDPLPALTSVWAASADDVWIGGGDKINFPIVVKLWHKIPDPDGGVAWEGVATCQYNGDCAVIRAIWGSSANDVWAVGDRGKSYHTTKVSSDVSVPTVFGQLESQSSAALRGIWGTDATNVWAVGDHGTIRHHGAGDGPWEVIASPTDEDLRAIWGSGKNDIWAVGDHGTIVHFDGSKWRVSPVSLPVGPKANFYGIWGSAANDIWVVGEGIVLRFTELRPATENVP